MADMKLSIDEGQQMSTDFVQFQHIKADFVYFRGLFELAFSLIKLKYQWNRS